MRYHLTDVLKGWHFDDIYDAAQIPLVLMNQYKAAIPKDAQPVGLFKTKLTTEDGVYVDWRDVVVGGTYVIVVRAEYEVLSSVEYFYDIVEASASVRLRRWRNGSLEEPDKLLKMQPRQVIHDEPKLLTNVYERVYKLTVTKE